MYLHFTQYIISLLYIVHCSHIQIREVNRILEKLPTSAQNNSAGRAVKSCARLYEICSAEEQVAAVRLGVEDLIARIR